MKKSLVAFVLLLFLLSSCSRTPAFRNVRWGDSPRQVADSEDPSLTTVIAEDDYILYSGIIDNFDADVFYQFSDGKLEEAQIQFHITGTREHVLMDFVTHYFSLNDLFTETYGTPLHDNFHVWLIPEEEIPLYEQDPYNQLMYYQRLEFRQEWVTRDTYVSLTLNYRNLQENFYYYACDIDLYESGESAVHF